jgi:hypothetical protein
LACTGRRRNIKPMGFIGNGNLAIANYGNTTVFQMGWNKRVYTVIEYT